jgi:hypothetical protein
LGYRAPEAPSIEDIETEPVKGVTPETKPENAVGEGPEGGPGESTDASSPEEASGTVR